MWRRAVTAAEEMELLERWCPRLRYDSQAVFCAVSAAAMTDAQGNRVTRGKRIPASASGVPLLSLDWLRDYEHRGSTKRRSRTESIRQGADRLGDAQQFQSHPHYADRVHGRVVEDGGAHAYLQYWLYFYSAPPAVSGGWDQPGWRLVQIQLADGRPVRVAVRNAAGRARQELNRAALSRPCWHSQRSRRARRRGDSSS